MALTPGTRLGVYDITAPIGEGGMGQVFRARDTKLDRDVAIKILPEAFAHDGDRLARFTREAKTLASLNHPHIAGIYGLEESGGVSALVMELVEGEDLSQRIARGAIPIDEALPIAKQIADALDAAHEQGIIHRDLKPANIKLRADGTVKILDFGLAKAMDPAGSSSVNAMHSPTLSIHATMQGVILGTAAYMSPEQAAGKPVDNRSDLWAFGVVVLEMLTGRPVFTGETVSHVIASVLKSEPDWTTLPADTPAPIRRLLRRCLEKDRKRRLDSAADARLEIEDAMTAPATADGATASRGPAPRRWMMAAVGIAVVSVAATAVATWALTRPTPVKLQQVRFTIVPPLEHPLAIRGSDRDIAVSPDGKYLVYRVGVSGAIDNPLAVRALDQLDVHLLSGITSARGPFFSPDSRWIGFFDGSEIKKVLVAGGLPITVCRFSGLPRGGSWGEDNTIVFATNDPTTGLWRVPAGGGEPVALTTPKVSEGDHLFPSVLPGVRGVLFTISPLNQPENAQVAVLDLRTGERKALIRGSDGEYVASGHLVYVADGKLHAARFDLAKLEVMGDAVPIVDHVRVASNSVGGAVNYTVSHTGTLVYVTGDDGLRAVRQMVWVDRQGREAPINAPPRNYISARLSPDGTRIALDVRDQENDLWVWDITRTTLTRLTFGLATEQAPVWTPDGRRLVFASTRTGAQNLFSQAVDGTGTTERLTTSTGAQYPTSITPDGTRVVGFETGGKSGNGVGEGSLRVFLLPLAHPTGQPDTGPAPGAGPPSPLIQTGINGANPDVSPDGRFLAYQSNESGREEIYVRPFPDVNAGRWLISTGGGLFARWRPDGRELFYMDQAGTLMSVPIQLSATTLRAGTPGKVFDMQYGNPATTTGYDVSADGQRFLMIKDPVRLLAPTMVAVTNWFEELKARVPTK